MCGVCSVGKKYNPLDFYPLDFPLFPLDGNPVDFFAGFAERALNQRQRNGYIFHFGCAPSSCHRASCSSHYFAIITKDYSLTHSLTQLTTSYLSYFTFHRCDRFSSLPSSLSTVVLVSCRHVTVWRNHSAARAGREGAHSLTHSLTHSITQSLILVLFIV